MFCRNYSLYTTLNSTNGTNSASVAMPGKGAMPELSSLFYPKEFERVCIVISLLANTGFDLHIIKSLDIVNFNITAVNVEIYGKSESNITRKVIPHNSYPLGSIIINCYIKANAYETGEIHIPGSDMPETYTDKSFTRDYILTACISEKGQNYDWTFSYFSQ